MKINDQTCISNTLRVIGAKWTANILRELFDGTKRFGQLQRTLNISPKTLSMRLHQLEEEGIVSKKIYPIVPLKVEYSITRRGKTLGEIIAKMRDWGRNYQSH